MWGILMNADRRSGSQDAAYDGFATEETCWDRGRPARNEREARNLMISANLRDCGALRAGRPRSQHVS